MLDYEKKGWKLTTRGMPNFLTTQSFTRPRAVWVQTNLDASRWSKSAYTEFLGFRV
jgi:hypothetical protein